MQDLQYITSNSIENYNDTSNLTLYLILLITIDIFVISLFQPQESIFTTLIISIFITLIISSLSEKIYWFFNTNMPNIAAKLLIISLFTIINVRYEYITMISINFIVIFLIIWLICGIDIPQLIYYENQIYRLNIKNGTYVIIFSKNHIKIKPISDQYIPNENAIIFTYKKFTYENLNNNKDLDELNSLNVQIIKNDRKTQFSVDVKANQFLQDNLNAAIKEFYNI